MARHKDMKRGHCKLLKRALMKYEWDRMKMEVLWVARMSRRLLA